MVFRLLQKPQTGTGTTTTSHTPSAPPTLRLVAVVTGKKKLKMILLLVTLVVLYRQVQSFRQVQVNKLKAGICMNNIG